MPASKLLQLLALGTSLAGTAALAEDAASKAGTPAQLSCPSGTRQSGTPSEGLYCAKVVTKEGDNVPHGPYVSYHSNGQKRSEGQYFEGFRSGTWTFYDESGKETRATSLGEASRQGKRVQYFASGKPHRIEEYVNGKRHGVSHEFSEDGKLVRTPK